ncbi:MAG: helix-turn-helix domain-containing protein [Chitinophagaceae bacterium]
MNIDNYYPRHPILQQHVAFFYLLKAESPDFNTTYYAFPNINVPLSIHKSAVSDIKDNYTGVYANASNTPLALIQRSYQAPLLINLKGPVNKLTIVFKPMGINRFISQPFSVIAAEDSQVFTDWQQYNQYHDFLQQFFAATDIEEQQVLLENFLLSVYNNNIDYETVEKAIALLTDFAEEHSIEAIAEKLELTVRSFNRLFDKHMSISPVAYKKIARFRHSMQNKLFSERFKKLTEIGYASNFYDQAYFIKVYNKLTGSNPSAFFNSIEKLADDRLIFKFVKE